MTSPAAQRTPVPAKWTAEMLPAVSGKVAIVTGGEASVGFHTALELARRGAHVVVASHKEEEGRDAVAKIEAAIADAEIQGGKAEFMYVDMGSLASVKSFSETFKQNHDRLDMLVNNAVVIAPKHGMNEEGFEVQFAFNHLGRFAMVSHLMEILLKNPDQARVVSISSMLHRRSAPFNPDEVMVTDAAKYKPIAQYSKMTMYALLFTFELQRRLEAKGITNVISVGTHPGVVTSKVQLNDFSEIALTLEVAKKQMHAPELGARPILYASAAPGVIGGDYYGPEGPLAMSGDTNHEVPSAFALSEENARQLWIISEKMSQVEFDV